MTRYIDLFSGIGGFHIGLKMAGFLFSWVGFSEVDPYAIKVYEKNFPDAHNLGDITKIDGTKYKGTIDFITGGFPCQDISVAGKGVGIDGKRSGLWKEMHRLVCEVRPRCVIVENVPALLAKGLFRVLGDLASCRYDAEWDCIPASALGAPHRRDRIWVVAYPSGIRCNSRRAWKPLQGVGPFDEVSSAANAIEEKDQFLAANTSIKRRAGRQGHSEADRCNRREKVHQQWGDGKDWHDIAARLCRMDDGVPNRVDRLKCLGNAVVPQVVAWLGKKLKDAMDRGVL